MATTIIIALIVALLVAALVVTRVRRRTEPEVVVETPSISQPPVVSLQPDVARHPALPVVLVHGLFGFDRIGAFDYFRGIARHLDALGCHAHAVRLPPAKSVPARAVALASAIDALPHERVDVIAHSMGGLDARYALARLGLARRVRSLVTIGTPHHGTPIADLATTGAVGWARRMLATIGLPIEALEYLTTSGAARFNDEIRDVPGVRYACVVGRAAARMPLPLVPAHAYLRRVAGANDGLVPVASQRWGETLLEAEADHFAQVGWLFGRDSFDATGLYAFVVARLGDLVTPTASAKPPLEQIV